MNNTQDDKEVIVRLLNVADSLTQTVKRLLDEKEELRKNAERYHWLRDKCSNIDIQEGFGWISQNYETLDDAIDAEMKQKD